MHDDIRAFRLEGEISDDNLVETKERLIRFVEVQMYDEGYAPVLDLGEHFTLDYQPDTETYQFRLTVYGAEGNCSAISNGKQIPFTHQNKWSRC